MDETLIERDEIVALLFAVNDINATLLRIERLVGQEDDDEAQEDE